MSRAVASADGRLTAREHHRSENLRDGDADRAAQAQQRVQRPDREHEGVALDREPVAGRPGEGSDNEDRDQRD